MANITKKWKILPGSQTNSKSNHPKWLLDILANRGIAASEKIEKFLEPSYDDLLLPDDFLNINEIAQRLIKARDLNESVVVYGDYDVDGITSVALVADLLNKIGLKKAEKYIPHREEEGYGLNEEAVESLIKKGHQLIVTVDCGITSGELIKKYQDKIEFIVIDHHEIQPEKLPQKSLILHPSLFASGIKHPPTGLSACGMAFFLAKKMTELPESGFTPGQEKWLLDLAALSTICDVVPLVEQNRLIAKYGLKVLSKTKRLGLVALASIASIKIEEIKSYEVGFVLGPRLNASGRLESAQKSLDLLMTDSKAEAMRIAAELNNINKDRQDLCERILAEARAQVADLQDKESAIYLLSDPGWPRGVVGIIASRLTENYSRPVIVFENDGKILHGSARSIDGLDITAALSAVSDDILKFGGRAKAAGLSVEVSKWDDFKNNLTKEVDKRLKSVSVDTELRIDTKISESEITEEVIDLIETLEPFGFGNSTPVFLIEDAVVRGVNRVGSQKEHLKFKLESSGISGISFSNGTPLKDGDKVDLVGTLKYNIWNSRKSIEIRVTDLKVKE